jgi:hypothetical protein
VGGAVPPGPRTAPWGATLPHRAEDVRRSSPDQRLSCPVPRRRHPVLQDGLDRRSDPLGPRSCERRHPEHRRPGDETEAIGDRPLGQFPLLLVDGVPLVEEDHERHARLHDLGGDALILMGHAVEGVDDEQGHIGLRQRLPGPQHGVEVGVLVICGLRRMPGGVGDAILGVRRWSRRRRSGREWCPADPRR